MAVSGGRRRFSDIGLQRPAVDASDHPVVGKVQLQAAKGIVTRMRQMDWRSKPRTRQRIVYSGW